MNLDANRFLMRIGLVTLVIVFVVYVRFGQHAQADDTTEPRRAELVASGGDEKAAEKEDEIKDPPYKKKTDRELRRSLTSIQYKVTQNEDTEPAFRNKYWDNKKKGIYRCIVCEQALFSSDTKYKSGTGWPSFYDPIKKSKVGLKTDYFLFYPRTEVHCSRCGAHLGHVFDDGPRDKTGKRYCMNSASLKFEAEKDSKKDEDAKK